MFKWIPILVCWTHLAFSQDDFFRHPTQGDPYELWSYQFIMDNGTRLWLTYSNITLPAVGKKNAAELSLYQFKNSNHAVGRQFPSNEWKEDRITGTIEIKDGYGMYGLPGKGHRVHFATSKSNGFLVDLTFLETQGADSTFRHAQAGTPVQMAIHIPQGRVRGKIAVGKDTLSLNGSGSLIHTWHDKPLTEIARQSIRFLASGASPLSGQVLIGKNGKPLGHAAKLQDGKWIFLTPKSIQFAKGNIQIDWNQGEVKPLAWNINKPFQKYSVLSTVDSWMERQAAKVAMGGDRIFLRGMAHMEFGPMEWVAAGFSE